MCYQQAGHKIGAQVVGLVRLVRVDDNASAGESDAVNGPDACIQREHVARIEKLVGVRVKCYRRVEAGYSPAIRIVCEADGASFFVKIGATQPTANFLRREIGVYNAIRADFRPKLIACDASETNPILIIEDFSRHYWPPPWDERRIGLVMSQIEALHARTGEKWPPPPDRLSLWASRAQNGLRRRCRR